jgi:hypothetical protein
MFALVFNGKVTDVVPERFSVAQGFQWVNCKLITPPNPGDLFDGFVFSKQQEPVVPIEIKRKQEYAAIDGDGIEAMREVLRQLYIEFTQLAPPKEFVDYLAKVQEIKIKYPKV